MSDELPADERAVAEGAALPARGAAGTKAIAVLAVVFLLGGAAGGAVGRLSAMRDFRHMVEGPPPEARARFRMEAMRRHLDLRDDQVPRLQTIMAEADAERDKLMESCGPGLDALRKRTDERVREVLDEEQRKRFDDMGVHRGGRPHGPRPPPP